MSGRTLTVILLIASTAIVSGFLFFGVTAHTEPTFFKGCWYGNTFIFPKSSELEEKVCGDKEVVTPHWPRRRVLTVRTVSFVQDHHAITEDVVDEINSHLGVKRLTVTDDPDADITVQWNQVIGVAGLCSIYRNGEESSSAQKAFIQLSAELTTVYDWRTLYHELGHCGLMLAHDDYRTSPMYTHVQSPDVIKFFKFSDMDLAAVREYLR